MEWCSGWHWAMSQRLWSNGTCQLWSSVIPVWAVTLDSDMVPESWKLSRIMVRQVSREHQIWKWVYSSLSKIPKELAIAQLCEFAVMRVNIQYVYMEYVYSFRMWATFPVELSYERDLPQKYVCLCIINITKIQMHLILS